MTPLEELRERLHAERLTGATFERGWQQATARVLAGCPESSRLTWREIFDWGRETWRRAYEGAPRRRVDYLAPLSEVEAFVPTTISERMELVA